MKKANEKQAIIDTLMPFITEVTSLAPAVPARVGVVIAFVEPMELRMDLCSVADGDMTHDELWQKWGAVLRSEDAAEPTESPRASMGEMEKYTSHGHKLRFFEGLKTQGEQRI